MGLKKETGPGKRIPPTSKLQDLSSKVFKDGRGIDSCFRTDPNIVLGPILQITVNTANRELEKRAMLVLEARCISCMFVHLETSLGAPGSKLLLLLGSRARAACGLSFTARSSRGCHCVFPGLVFGYLRSTRVQHQRHCWRCHER